MIPGVVEEYTENTALGRTGVEEEIGEVVGLGGWEEVSWDVGKVVDDNGGAHLKRYPNIYEHMMKLAGQ